MSNSKKSYGQIIILIVVVSLFFGANSAFASEVSCICAEWEKHAYKLGETGTFTLESITANKNPFLIDFSFVHLSSDSDKIGSDYLVEETGVNTGYFSGEIQFGTDTDGVASLKTNVGDLVYVKLSIDTTLLGDSAKILSSLDDSSPTVQYIVVTTDKASYSEGETVRITGEVRDLFPNGTLKIFVGYPELLGSGWRMAALASQEVAVGADKKFILTHTAGGEKKVGGTYTITASYWANPVHGANYGRSADTTYEFYPTLPSSPTSILIAEHPQPVAEVQAPQMLMIPVVVTGIGAGIGIGISVFVIKRRK